MKNTKRLTVMAMMIALGLVLPPIIRLIPNGGVLFSPMHISPLLTGLIIGPFEGIIVGLVCPLFNNLLYGMPQGSTLICMCFELPVYGMVSGLCMHLFKKYKGRFKVYASLIVAMVIGRIIGGIVHAMILKTTYSINIWLTSYFISTAPAIIIHIILLPLIYFSLKKSGLIQSLD